MDIAMVKKFHRRNLYIIFMLLSVSAFIISGCDDGQLPPAGISGNLSLTLSGTADGSPYVKEISFSSANSTVSVTVSNALESIDVELAAEISGFSVSVNGGALAAGTKVTIVLSVGLNEIPVVITPDSGDIINYLLKINRAEPAALSGNADLSSLELSAGVLDPDFSASVTEYGSSVSSATASLTVTAATAHSAAAIKVNGTPVVSGTASQDIGLDTGDNTIEVTVTAEDGETVKTYTVTVERRAAADTEPPVLTLIGDDPMTAPYGSVFTDPGAEAVDNLDGSWTVYSDDEVDTNTAGEYSLEYNATDLDGNAAVPVTRSVTVPEPPEISTLYVYTGHPSVLGYGRIEVTASLFGLYTQAGDTVIEATLREYDNDADYFIADYLAGEYQRHAWVEVSADVYTVTAYEPVSDIGTARTNTDVQVVETWYADPALTIPVIILTGDEDVTISVGESWTDPGAVVKDWDFADTGITASDDDGFDADVPGAYTFTYSYTDTDGNSAVEVTRTVTVNAPEELALPDFYRWQADGMDCYLQFVFSGSGYTVTNEDSEVISSGTVTGYYNDSGQVVLEDGDGFWRIDWTEPADGVFTVQEFGPPASTADEAWDYTEGNDILTAYTDTSIIPPVLLLNGDDPLEVDFGVDLTDPGAEVEDWNESYETVYSDDAAGVDTNTSGDYTIGYNITDTEGNSAAEVTRTVTVKEPCEIAELYVFEPDHNQCWLLLEITGGNMTTKDSPGGEPSSPVQVIEYDNDSNHFIYYDSDHGQGYIKFTWTEPDGAGHTTVTQYYGYETLEEARNASTNGTDYDAYTIEASVPPVLLLNGEETVVMAAGGVYTEEGASAPDWDESPEVIIDDSELDTSADGTYSIYYSCTDSDGNTAVQVTRTVVVGSGMAEIIIQ